MKRTELHQLADEVINGIAATRDDLLEASRSNLNDLAVEANRIARACCGDSFDMCSIDNVKSGRCPENCRWCAQSAHWNTCTDEYPLKKVDDLVAAARICANAGATRFSLVSSGRRPSQDELAVIRRAVERICNEVDISVCASLGLLDESDFFQLKEAGLTRVHNNLETSRRFWPQVCTTHSYDDKINAIKAAQRAGLEVCSGGIIGLGETLEDRLDLALELRSLGAVSIPVNVLNPIPGTPFENNEPLSYEEVLKTIALFRFALPKTAIRLAGGRTKLPDAGAACFTTGANATISGDMLTTAGYSFASDKMLAEKLSYKVRLT